MQTCPYPRTHRLRLRHCLLAIYALLMVPGCKSESADDHVRFPGGKPVVGLNCGSVAPGGNPATVDTSATPRADADAEILALETSAEIVAPEALYQRISAELTGIRATVPGAAAAAVFPCHAPDSILVFFNEQGFERVRTGTYTAWDDLNANLRVQRMEILPSLMPASPVRLHFEGRYNAKRLAQAYGALPDVEFASVNGFSGDGSDICLARRAQHHFYIFREAHGDCPAGCIRESFTAVSVDGDGNVTPVGTWDGAGSAPDWFEEAVDCRPFLATHEP